MVVWHLQEFCQQHRQQSGNSAPIPYYETSTKFRDSIVLAFQEIMARPLINEYVVSFCFFNQGKGDFVGGPWSVLLLFTISSGSQKC